MFVICMQMFARRGRVARYLTCKNTHSIIWALKDLATILWRSCWHAMGGDRYHSFCNRIMMILLTMKLSKPHAMNTVIYLVAVYTECSYTLVIALRSIAYAGELPYVLAEGIRSRA